MVIQTSPDGDWEWWRQVEDNVRNMYELESVNTMKAGNAVDVLYDPKASDPE